MRTQIVILGGGTGGTMVANRLRRRFDADDVDIHVVDRDDRHIYQSGLLFVPFGLATIEEIVRPRHRQLLKGIEFHEDEVETVFVGREEVRLSGGKLLPYHVLVVATGVRLLPEETPGLTGPGWNERAFTFYTAAGAEALQERLERFDGGRSWSTSSTCRSSARSRRSSSRSSPIGISASEASATGSTWPMSRRSTAPSRAGRVGSARARCSPPRRSS